jgi:hypothetical protein
LPKEDPKSINAINQPHNLDEYKYKSYEELSKEFQEACLAAARAFALIPQMYNRLTRIDGLTHKDAIAKIRNDHDHLPGFSPRNIRRYLPVNNANIPRRVRTSRPKNSVTETCVGTFFSDTKHNDEKNINHKIGRQSISNDVVDDVSSDQTTQIEGVTAKRNVKSDLRESPYSQELEEALKAATNMSTVDAVHIVANKANKADLKTCNIMDLQILLPSRQSRKYISSQLKKGKNQFYLSLIINVDTGKIISVRTGRNSEYKWDRYGFENTY